MNYDQISEGGTYAGLRGKRRTVTCIAPDQPWFSVPSIKRRDCTYVTTKKDGTEREYTIRLDMFAKWAQCDVTEVEE